MGNRGNKNRYDYPLVLSIVHLSFRIAQQLREEGFGQEKYGLKQPFVVAIA
jgi:hypothetical protein